MVQKNTLDLEELRLSTTFKTLSSLEAEARDKYMEHYCGVEHCTHDGQVVKFFEDRFEHAFFRDVKGKKDELDIERAERIMWIGELIKGAVPTSECRLVPDDRTGRPKRLYLIKSELYVVWLEPLRVGWRFSTAYKPYGYKVRRYREEGELIWQYGRQNKCPVIVGLTGPEAKSTP